MHDHLEEGGLEFHDKEVMGEKDSHFYRRIFFWILTQKILENLKIKFN